MKTLQLLLTGVIMISFLACEKDNIVPGNEYQKIASTKTPCTYSLICGGNATDEPCCKMWLHDEGYWSLQFFSNGTVLEKIDGNSSVASWKLDDAKKEIKIEYILSPDSWNNKVLSIEGLSEKSLLLKDHEGNYHPFTKH